MPEFTKSYVEEGVEYGPRPVPMPARGPSEASEHARVAAALRRAGILFFHAPMGGARGRSSGAAARRMGASSGFPDFLVLDRPKYGPGVALELKRPVRGSSPSAEQVAWLEALAARGWLATVQWGAAAALEYLRRVGFAV